MARLPLWDVSDAEAFVGAIVERSRDGLSYHDSEDLRGELVLETWELSLEYKPGGVSFSTFAGTTLRHRVVDWRRKRFGRTRWTFGDGRVYERPRTQFVPLDDPGVGRLDAAESARAGDSSADWNPSFARLEHERDRARERDLRRLGLHSDC